MDTAGLDDGTRPGPRLAANSLKFQPNGDGQRTRTPDTEVFVAAYSPRCLGVLANPMPRERCRLNGVPRAGLEPARRVSASADFKSAVSTSFTTRAMP